MAAQGAFDRETRKASHQKMADHGELSLFPIGVDITDDICPTPSTFQSPSPYPTMHRNDEDPTHSRKQSNVNQASSDLGEGSNTNNQDNMKHPNLLRVIRKQDSTVSSESENISNAELWSRLNALHLTTTLSSSSQSEPDLEAIIEVLVMPRKDYGQYGDDISTAGVFHCTFMTRSPPKKNVFDLRSYSL